MSENVAEINLEQIPEIFKAESRKLESLIGKLNKRLEIIKTTNQKEKEFYNDFEYVKKVYEVLNSFFYGITIKDLDEIKGELEKFESLWRKKVAKFGEDIKSKEFSDDHLTELYNDLIQFLNHQISFLEEVLRSQEKIFEKSKNEISDKFNALSRFVNVLIKRIESSEVDKIKLGEVIKAEFDEVKQLVDKIPRNITELTNIIDQPIQGLYTRVKDELYSKRDKLKRLAVENQLLSENEVAVLETLYEERIKEDELGKVVQIVMQRLGIKKEDSQKLLFDLSEKGLLLIKLIAE